MRSVGRWHMLPRQSTLWQILADLSLVSTYVTTAMTTPLSKSHGVYSRHRKSTRDVERLQTLKDMAVESRAQPTESVTAPVRRVREQLAQDTQSPQPGRE